jgi:DNA-binding NarL/FixJ family response regulator
MRIPKTRQQQQQQGTLEKRARAAKLAKLGLSKKAIAERLGVAGSTVSHLLSQQHKRPGRSPRKRS